ncbi:hypothetical protein NDU88_006398 [Pleurodeles waltl]|uniref:Uncharacterized protein n=1 Tax=Pleurodeles waltl TaxID=8319 RepID=A0AAV7TFE7_PLEWA|nr:hypothetical protein NDU88_006398 [Pleurodeles waltl]
MGPEKVNIGVAARCRYPQEAGVHQGAPQGTSRLPFLEPGAATDRLRGKRELASHAEAGELPELNHHSEVLAKEALESFPGQTCSQMTAGGHQELVLTPQGGRRLPCGPVRHPRPVGRCRLL